MSESPHPAAPEFHITHDQNPSETLLAGFSSFGLAGLTAVDYLVEHLDLEQQGHLTVEGLPSITPFENGRPRHHTRIFSHDDVDVSILVGELVLPIGVSREFADVVVDWMGANEVEELAICSGIPIAHGPDEHRTFYIATDDYRKRRLEDGAVTPMGSGFLDGTNAALISRGISSPLAIGVFVTPIHQQVPDVEAAVRLVETVDSVYGLDVDTGPLAAFAEEVHQYYAELAERLERRVEDLPEDRMYM